MYIVIGVSSLDFGVKIVDYVVKYLYSDVVFFYIGVRAVRVFICGFKNFKGVEFGGKIRVFNRLNKILFFCKKKEKRKEFGCLIL